MFRPFLFSLLIAFLIVQIDGNDERGLISLHSNHCILICLSFSCSMQTPDRRMYSHTRSNGRSLLLEFNHTTKYHVCLNLFTTSSILIMIVSFFSFRSCSEGRSGIPLRLAITVMDTNNCTPLANVLVDLWHCDAMGIYSHYIAASQGNASGGNDNQTFFRGTAFLSLRTISC